MNENKSSNAKSSHLSNITSPGVKRKLPNPNLKAKNAYKNKSNESDDSDESINNAQTKNKNKLTGKKSNLPSVWDFFEEIELVLNLSNFG